MKGKTHAAVGVTTFFLIYDKIPGKFSYMGVLIVFVASLLPDIDHPKSIFNKYILLFKNKTSKLAFYSCAGILVLWYDYLYTREPGIKALGIMLLLVAISSHRNGLTHSLMGMILFSFLAGYIGNMYNIHYIVYYCMIGYGSHLLCDMATNRGIPLLYPFNNKKFKLPLTYKTNSKLGTLIETILTTCVLFFTIYKLPIIFPK
ncbi:metal-dependent hydrolase [Clostridium niameyense]|uniref:Metal-dependent hydrolase n=1 Tax=Clostridium niameyense TaxID=1622073 RepID=A0A6M0RAP3_9CLOT|nr:metal-dependent hydrolase [Clostridium niameyense]NEZ46730.1 metal-dependent hydrolase [Clostridium niameyense]